MAKNSQVITRSPEIMRGTPVFAGTRVPVQTLLDYLKAGESINDFLDGFPTVTREQVISFLDEAERQLKGRRFNSVYKKGFA
jgi:uncharacterized protein (DUF433 family)